MLTRDHSRLCQLNVPTFDSKYENEYLYMEKVLQTEKIYSSYYSSNADKFSEEIKGKLNIHFEFVNRCDELWDEIWEGGNGFRNIEKWVIESSFNPSSIRNERRNIQHDIQNLYDKCNRRLEKIILTFDHDHLEDKNANVEKALQSLRQLLASEFD